MPIFALLRALPLIWQLGIYAALFAAGLAGYGVWHHQVYQSGYAAALHKIAAQDEDAIHAAHEAVANRHACIAAGRLWSVETGECAGR
jgi:hypothetical protein